MKPLIFRYFFFLREKPRGENSIHSVILFRHFRSAGPVTTLVPAIFALALISSALAQERVRTSAVPLPIESFRRPPEEFFQLGPFQEELAGSAGVQYTDNVNLAATNKISNLSFYQGLGLNTVWILSHLNKLELNFGGQLIENFYGNGQTRVNFAVDPNTKIEFKFSIGETRVRLYEQFSYVQNPTTDPTATNTANLNSLTNTIGGVVEQDLGPVVLSLLGDFSYNNQSGSNSQGQDTAGTTGSRESFRVGPAATFQLSSTILYGVDAVATRSTGNNSANVNSLSAGPFIKGKLSRDFEFDLAAGVTLVDTTPSIPTDYYASAVLRYQFTHASQVVFSASHNLIFTTGTDLTEQNLFQLGVQTGITRFITVSVAPFLNYGEVLNQAAVNNSVSQGPYTLFGIEAAVTWRPRKRWSTSLTYNYIRRESNSSVGNGTSSNNYIQNTIALSVRYAF